jgi:hypothetical protein
MWSYQSYQSLAVTLLQDVPEEPSLTMVSGAASPHIKAYRTARLRV